MLGWSITKTRLCTSLGLDAKSLPGGPNEQWLVAFGDYPDLIQSGIGAPRIFRFFGDSARNGRSLHREGIASDLQSSTPAQPRADPGAPQEPEQPQLPALGRRYRSGAPRGSGYSLPRSRAVDEFTDLASVDVRCESSSSEHPNSSEGEIDLCGESDEDVEVSSEGGYQSFEVGDGAESEEEPQPSSSRGYWYCGDAKRGKRSILSEREPSNGVGEELSRDRTQPDGHVAEGKEN